MGEIYKKQPKTGKFIMEVSQDVLVDAEHDLYDIGYLYFLDPEFSKCLHNPPNYGRYINTIYPEDLELGCYSYNRSFVGDERGLNAIWVVALVDIPANVELLVVYGPAYQLSRKPVLN